LNQIYSYLKSSEADGLIVKGVKVFDKRVSRALQLIERLKVYTPPGITYKSLEEDHFINQHNKEWYMYRNLSLIAINEYIQEFPFLMHTPSSLRSIFGMPTRKDRKRGKFSGKELIDKALKENYVYEEKINYEAISELTELLTIVSEEHTEHAEQCNNLINYLEANLKRNSLQETYVPEISTHSLESLDFAKEYLIDLGFNEVIHERDLTYPYVGDNKILTPDLLCTMWDEQVWFELKEWESFNNFFSPIKQIFAYLQANRYSENYPKSLVGILVTHEVAFYEFLKSFKPNIVFLKDIRTAITPRLTEIKIKLNNIHDSRKKFLDIGKLMLKNNLQIKTEALYIGLFSEFVNKELGMLNSEYESGLTVLEIIQNLIDLKADKVIIIPLEEIFSFDIGTIKENTLIIFLGKVNINKH
jgi:hypothetical protein